MLLVVPCIWSQISLIHVQVNGAKTLVLDSSIAGPLSLITEVSLFKVCYSFWELDLHLLVKTQHHGVDKMFWLEPGPLSAITTNIVYLLRPSIKHAKIISGTRSCFSWDCRCSISSKIRSRGMEMNLRNIIISCSSSQDYQHWCHVFWKKKECSVKWLSLNIISSSSLWPMMSFL